MPTRTWDAESSYRYGFNTQERVDEISGKGNHNTALFWEYDTRLGRRWNLDPKPQVFISDYTCLGNNPIWFTDVLGDTSSYYYKCDLVFTSNDKLDNALVDLSNNNNIEDIENLKSLIINAKSDKEKELINSNGFNRILRKQGVAYFPDEYLNFYNENNDDYFDQSQGLVNEHTSYLLLENGEAHLTDINVRGQCNTSPKYIIDAVDINTGKTIYDFGLTQDNSSYLHTHPNSSNGPTKDIDWLLRAGITYDIVVNQTMIILYNGKSGGTIKLNKNNLYPQTQ